MVFDSRFLQTYVEVVDYLLLRFVSRKQVYSFKTLLCMLGQVKQYFIFHSIVEAAATHLLFHPPLQYETY